MNEVTGSREPVKVAQDSSTTTITFDDPERSNSITSKAMRQLISGLRRAHDESSLLLVLRARGSDFTVGRDQSDSPRGVSRSGSLRLILEANSLLRTFPGISVCIIQGRALGFGSGLAVQCDVTIGADDAILGFDEVQHGLAPLIVAAYLPQFLGPKIAAELLISGRLVPAEEAIRLGMLNKQVSASELEREAERMINHLRSLEPGALRLMKQYLIDAGHLENPEEEAVNRLDAWLSAGRPAKPS